MTLQAQQPKFAEGWREGKPQQQDAEELLSEVAKSVQTALSEPSILPASSWGSLLGLEMEETWVSDMGGLYMSLLSGLRIVQLVFLFVMYSPTN